ncbi:putative quinol monooxygenase [Sorangium sp. So ce117]|uniref:putative quinol monooxygenase n=1 Tax=Sorangium sp. So ce117 TaxID=3133277 RepID=UPI003F602BD8
MIGGIKRAQAKAGSEAEFEAIFRTHAAAVRAHEPGTLSYDLFRDGAPGRYVVLDRYQDGRRWPPTAARLTEPPCFRACVRCWSAWR